jgi:hypothetical protein
VIDTFTLALTHGLMAIALWRLLARPDLDVEGAPEPVRPWIKRPTKAAPPIAVDESSSDA